RILAATNRSLHEEIRKSCFRSDLYFRLAVVEMELPPLRARLSDIPALIEEARRVISVRWGRMVARPSEEAVARLARHSWPGNGRELFNLVERIAACWPGRRFDELLAEEVLRPYRSAAAEASALDLQRAGTERMDLETLLDACDGNVSLASRKLGMSRSTLRRRLGRLVDTPSSRSRERLELPFTRDSSFHSG
ncbi:sigma 54-interacting transcriptional regulator, partial [Myxococcota bacterium]|nr:sigma 54-interacting transcriptional regulator [Myxococcota bacterium]